MEQEQKLSVEEEKRLITFKGYLKKIEDTQIYNEHLIGKRDQLVDVLRHLLTPLGMNIVNLKKSEAEIISVLEDELTDDIYEADPIFKDVKYYIMNSKDIFGQQEKFMHILAQFIIDFIALSNDITPISSSRKVSRIDDGTPALSEEEREKLKRTAYTLILNYKKQTARGNKNIIASRLLHFADTKEKYSIINDLFLDLAGERVLDKLKKKKPKEDDKHSADGRHEGRE